MKPAPFEYAAPATLAEALALKAEHGDAAKFLAGGQSLVPAMNFRLVQAAVLVDLNRLEDLAYIRVADDGGLRLGAMTRQRRLERDPLIRQHAPLLFEAMPEVAHPQIRNRGTLGGSLAHADPAGELPVIAVALEAQVRVQSAQASRWLPAGEFFQGLFTTALAADEMLVEVALPPRQPRTGTAFVEFARRRGDYALMGVAAVVVLDEDGRCDDARLVYLNAGDGPVSAPEAADELIGETAMPEVIAEAAAHASEAEINPMGNVHATPAYQRHLARVLTRRALEIAFDRAEERCARVTPLLPVRVTVNGKVYERQVEARLLLSDFLRHELGLTGTHVGCEHGVCGACTILFDGEPVRSCLTLAVQAHEHTLMTVEGLAPSPTELHPLQQAFVDAHGLQCGFCTPGILLTLLPFLQENPDPSDHAIREAISGNLCRCTGYQHIVDAARLAAKRMK